MPVNMTIGTGPSLPICIGGVSFICDSSFPCPAPLPAAFGRYFNISFFAGVPIPAPTEGGGGGGGGNSPGNEDHNDDDDDDDDVTTLQNRQTSPLQKQLDFDGPLSSAWTARRHGRRRRRTTTTARRRRSGGEKKMMSPHTTSSSICLSQIIVTVKAEAGLSPQVDESYTLNIPISSTTAYLSANTQWGALRGLESFSQLIIWQGPDAGSGGSSSSDNIDNPFYSSSSSSFSNTIALGTLYAITATPIYIEDYPRFNHRGVLIDTSFNYLTPARIRDVLDSCAVSKFNILHWHIVDDPSFPQESLVYPNFTAYGAYASTAIYSVEVQAALKQYAYERGVMILFELDVPGHSASWGSGNPSYVTACDGHQTLINPVGEVGQPGTIYEVLEKLMLEFYSRFGSELLPWVHLGGDEVTDYTCWNTSQEVIDWAISLGLPPHDPLQVRKAFTKRIVEIAQNIGLRPLFWEETFNGAFVEYNSSLPATANPIITPWVTPTVAKAITQTGFDALIYVGYYTDQWVPPASTAGWYSATVNYGYIDSLNLFYAFDPVNSTGVNGTGHESKILGGVASAWGDNVDSALGATSMLYPRGLAIAEKLWSAASYTLRPGSDDPTNDDIYDDLQARIEHGRCKLVQRGIGAGPVGVAGDYGFCSTPAWQDDGNSGNNNDNDNGDTITVTSAQVAGIVIGSGVTTALLIIVIFHGSAFTRLASTFISGKDGASASSAANVTGEQVLASSSTSSSTSSSSSSSSSQPFPPRSSSSSSSSSSSPTSRVVALDQLRGITMAAMLFVNLYYGYSQLPPFFSHGIVFFSGPDLIEPCFHFCVGFALRLVLVKRLLVQLQQQFQNDRQMQDLLGGDSKLSFVSSTLRNKEWWNVRFLIFKPLFRTRVIGLIILSCFFTEGWGQFGSWSQIRGFHDWIGQLVQDNQPYHTLLHIALLTIYTFLPMTMHYKVRMGFMFLTLCACIILQATFYFRWIRDYNLDEGGYYGFLGWSIEALTGSLVYDVVAWANASTDSDDDDDDETGKSNGVPVQRTSNKQHLVVDGGGRGEAAAKKVPLLKEEKNNNNTTAAAGRTQKSINSYINTTTTTTKNRQQQSHVYIAGEWTLRPRMRTACRRIFLGAAGLMIFAYLLSCLGAVLPLTKCYDGQRIFFWGGFGADADCSNVPTYGGTKFLVAPPFFLPNPDTNVVTMWTMTQRAGSPTYHLFASGTSAAFFALLYFLCEIGIQAPRWWVEKIAGLGANVFGLRLQEMAVVSNRRSSGSGSGGEENHHEQRGMEEEDRQHTTLLEQQSPSYRILLRWHVAEVLGENALAVYLIGDATSNNMNAMLPLDCPAWYFLLWGEALYLGVVFLAASYLRAHKLFLRL